jgi:hypothetical protein
MTTLPLCSLTKLTHLDISFHLCEFNVLQELITTLSLHKLKFTKKSPYLLPMLLCIFESFILIDLQHNEFHGIPARKEQKIIEIEKNKHMFFGHTVVDISPFAYFLLNKLQKSTTKLVSFTWVFNSSLLMLKEKQLFDKHLMHQL